MGLLGGVQCGRFHWSGLYCVPEVRTVENGRRQSEGGTVRVGQRFAAWHEAEGIDGADSISTVYGMTGISQERTVYRMTLVKGMNEKELDRYLCHPMRTHTCICDILGMRPHLRYTSVIHPHTLIVLNDNEL